MITLDTSGLLALIDRRERDRAAAVATFDSDPGPYFIPVPILSEIAWLIENRFRPEVEAGQILGLLSLAGMEIELSGILGRQAEMRTAEGLSCYFRAHVIASADPLYVS